MNPTDMSGDDLCEQPVLQWPELRALAGLGALAIGLLIVIRAATPLGTTDAQPAAAEQAYEATVTPTALPYNDLEWEPVPPDPESLPTIEALY